MDISRLVLCSELSVGAESSRQGSWHLTRRLVYTQGGCAHIEAWLALTLEPLEVASGWIKRRIIWVYLGMVVVLALHGATDAY